MTNEEAIKHLTNDWYKSSVGQIFIDSDKADSFLEAVGVGIKAINAYPPAHIDREAWVSVGDRLPEPESGPYWVAKKKNNGEWQMKMALFCDYGYAMPVDAKTDVTWRDFDYTKIVNVTHWRTLPDLPDEP